MAAELSQALSSALSLSDRQDCLETQPESGSGTPQDLLTAHSGRKSESDGNVKTSRKSSADISKLLQQHYCSHKNKKKHPVPSAGAIRKGKVPPPPSCVLGDGGDSTDELSEDSSSIAPDDNCSSSASSLGHVNNGKQCSCTHCEVFGHNNARGGQVVAPVNRKYPEMGERLRLLLSKKKKEQARCKQVQQGPPPVQKLSTCSSAASSVSSSSTSSIKSATPSGNIVKKEVTSNEARIKSDTPPPTKPAVLPSKAPATVPVVVQKPVATTARASPMPADPARVAAAKVNQQVRSQSASSLAPSTSSAAMAPIRKIEKSSSAVAPKAATSAVTGSKPPEKDLETLLDFIEGNASAANDKKKAKKERQKQQRMEEIRARELEERLRREAEEAEQKRKEEEERLREELERQMLKKAKKKAAQRAKKAAAKGVTIEELDDQIMTPAPAEATVTLEDLRARQLRELRELQERHQKQLEEEQRKLRETIEAAEAAKQDQSKKSKKKSKNKENNSKASTPAPSSSSTTTNNINSIMSSLSKAGPGTQIKITRTANGGVEFTTIPADGSAPQKPVISTPQPQMPPAYMQNSMFGQPTLQPYFPQPQPAQPQPPPPPSQPSQDRPSVPSKSSPSQPMVTIRRVEGGGVAEPTVTISMQAEKDNKLLYTLINGQIHRAKDAPADLIPGELP